MILEYGDLLSPFPIFIPGLGHIKKPFLKDIAELTFQKFSFYESFLKMTPEKYYTVILKERGGEDIWAKIPDDIKANATMFDVIQADSVLQEYYTDILNFFIEEAVTFENGFFKVETNDKNGSDNPKYWTIARDIFQDVLEIFQQICMIYTKEESLENMKFKNDRAKKLYEKMLKGKQEREKNKESDPRLSIPNIISAVSNYHKSITPVTVWDMTLFQLMDSFDRLQTDVIFEIDKRRTSVWGDKEKKFDPAQWYKYSNNVK